MNMEEFVLKLRNNPDVVRANIFNRLGEPFVEVILENPENYMLDDEDVANKFLVLHVFENHIEYAVVSRTRDIPGAVFEDFVDDKISYDEVLEDLLI